jgi:hypothetical protein
MELFIWTIDLGLADSVLGFGSFLDLDDSFLGFVDSFLGCFGLRGFFGKGIIRSSSCLMMVLS